MKLRLYPFTFIRKTAEKITGLLFPHLRCLACGEETELHESGLCAACALELEGGFLLIQRPIGAAVCYSAFPYDDSKAPAKLVRRLKFGGIIACGDILGEYCARAIAEAGIDFDVIVPVPISKRRISERGFNQSCIIAKKISEITGVPCEELLIKSKHTKEQSKLSRNERLVNVQGAYTSRITKNLHILLVDDVLTTGATALECRFTLMSAGAARVYILSATAVMS